MCPPPQSFWFENRIRRTYLGVLLFIAALAVVHFVVLYFISIRQQYVLNTLQLLFDQRYRVMQITLFTTLDQRAVNEELEIAIGQLEAAHQQFLSIQHPGIDIGKLDEQLTRFLNTSKQVEGQSAEMVIHYPLLISAINGVVDQYNDANDKLTSVKHYFELGSFVFTLSSLVGMSFFIFRPMEQYVYREREALKKEIRERERAEKDAIQSQRLYRVLVNNLSGMSVILFDRDMKYLLAEGELLSATGYNAEMLVGKTPDEVMPPQLASQINDLFRRVLDGAVIAREQQAANADIIYFSRSLPVRDENDHIIGGIILAQDITERKRAEEALRQSEQRLQMVMENFPEGAILMFDHDLRYLVAKGTGLGVVGHSSEALEGKTLYEAETGETQTAIETLYRRTLAGEVIVNEMFYRDHWYSVRTQPIQNPQGEIVAGMVVTMDITVLKLAQMALMEQQRLKVELQKEHELSLMQTQMMMRISHEFRTPLAVIQTSAELLHRYYDRLTEERRKQHFSSIHTSIEKITIMLDEISRVFRSQLQMEQARFFNVDLRQVCEQVINRVKVMYPAYELAVEGDSAVVVSDEQLLTIVIEQLLVNAVKYSRPDHPIRLQLDVENEQVSLRVKDGGIGIPQADLPHIFEPFYRGSNIGDITGIGVGLSTAKDILDVLGGTISVESREGEGSAFIVVLPAEKA